MTQPTPPEPVEEVCECGDWRSDHPNDGPCRHNGRGFDLCHAGQDCMSYRPALARNQTNG